MPVQQQETGRPPGAPGATAQHLQLDPVYRQATRSLFILASPSLAEALYHATNLDPTICAAGWLIYSCGRPGLFNNVYPGPGAPAWRGTLGRSRCRNQSLVARRLLSIH